MPKPSQIRLHPVAPSSSAPEAAPDASSVESLPVAGKRRSFTAAEKLRIVREANACTERGSVEALLRREGIYSSLLTAWRKQLALHGSEGVAVRTRGRKPKLDAKDRLIIELEKRAARLEAKLALADKLLALQKNTHGRSPTSWKRNSVALRAAPGMEGAAGCFLESSNP